MFKKYINHTLNENDLEKYKVLKNRENLLSFNIAVIGSKRKFKRYKNKLYKKYDGIYDIYISSDEDRLRIISKGIETNYIHIQNIEQLYGLTFSDYV